jgi:hypothetical protein
MTVRTFDGCFARMPERPRRTPVLGDVILVLSATISFAGLFGAITLWMNGLGEFRLEQLGILACCFLVTGAMLLLCALAPLSILRRNPTSIPTAGAPTIVLDRRTFARRWWEAFRLVILLAIGPALLALALATARVPVHVVPKVTTLPGGVTERIETHGTGTTYVTTMDAVGGNTFRFATAEEIAAAAPPMPSLPIGRYLHTALLAVLTILILGAAFVSLGLALGIWIRSRARAIAASVLAFLCVIAGWPILCVLLGYPNLPWWGLTLASPPVSFGALLFNMRHDVIEETMMWASVWIALFVVLNVMFVAVAFWRLDREKQVDSFRVKDMERPRRTRTQLVSQPGDGR